MPQDCESEIEELMNPKDELKKKIVTLANNMRIWNNINIKAGKSVKKQFEVILDLGLNKYKMEKTALRRLVIDIFQIHGVSDSWIRKQLPVELKDPSKTRLSYLQKQEIEKERQRLLKEQTSESQQELEIRENDLPNDSTVESILYQPTTLELNRSSSIDKQGLEIQKAWNEPLNHGTDLPVSEGSVTIQNKLSEANKKVERLEEEVQRLSKPFTTNTILQTADQDIPIVAQIDPVKKSITSIQIDKSY